jgi:Mg-chelatase subunit ChlD
MNKLLVKGSLSQISQQHQKPLAELFVNVTCAIIVDISGSMDIRDSREGKTRWQVASEELINLQAQMPGQIAVFAFADRCQFVPSGILPRVETLGGSTNMAGALSYVRSMSLDVPGIRIVLISDGDPNNKQSTLAAARKFTNRIDTIYVGPEGGQGNKFLAQLANESGGIAATADRVKELAETAQLLLMG